MKELSVEAEILLLLPAIHRVSHARMLDVFHMHANLMRAACKELAIDERKTVVVLPGSKRRLTVNVVMDGRASSRSENLHAKPVAAATRDRSVDDASIERNPPCTSAR